MIYLTNDELRRLLAAARVNPLHHLMFVTALYHALRVSELLNITGEDVIDGQLSVIRLKKGNPTIQPVHVDSDPVFDGSLLLELAKVNRGRIFDFSRQYADRLIKHYGRVAGLHPDKAHMHCLRHSTAVALWERTKDINCIVDTLGHKSPSSSLIYMRYDGAAKAQAALANMFSASALGAA